MIVLCAVAWAEEPPAEAAPAPDPAPEVIELSADTPVDSALDGFDDAAREVALQGDGVLLDEFLPQGLVRGRFFVRPLVALAWLEPGSGEGRSAAQLGVTLGHHWWVMGDRPITVGGETRLEASAPVGAASGRRLALSTRGGPWFGPIGLRVGPSVRWDREQWGTEVLEDAGLVGAGASLTADLGPVTGWIGAEPAWRVWGERPAVADGALPVLGDETTFDAGLGVRAGPLLVLVQGQHRDTAIGRRIEAGLVLHLQIP